MQSVVQIKNLEKKYGNFKLSVDRLVINEGEVFGLIGKNGAGKTTLLDLILNEIACDLGEILVFGRDNHKYNNEIKNNLGFMIDNASFSKDFKLREIDLVLRRIYKNWDSDYYFQLIKEFGLEPKANLGSLSKGMAIKAQLSVSLAHFPKLLILDEITSGLDPVSRLELLDLLNSYMAQNPNRTILFSTHIIDDLFRVATRVGCLNAGKFVFLENIEQHSEQSINLMLQNYTENFEVSRCEGC